MKSRCLSLLVCASPASPQRVACAACRAGQECGGVAPANGFVLVKLSDSVGRFAHAKSSKRE
jgi:hypothetical protein